MNFSTNITDLMSLVVSLSDICLAGAFVGCVLTLVETAFVLGFDGESKESGAVQPPVTILKPLHGSEPGLAARLSAFCRQDYDAPVQVLCGTQDHSAPAVAAVRDLQPKLPDGALELAIDPRSHGANGKVSNLINMLARARHDTIVVSDADIAVRQDYLRALAGLLVARNVGAVTCLYHGIGEGLWARVSALAINSHFLPQAITAIALRLTKPCCGATIAMHRSMLERIGGFSAFAEVLADDFAIGAAVRSTGYEIVTAPFLVSHHCFEDSLRQLFLHQLRVARTIKSIDPIGYAGTILTHPWPLALLGLLSGSTASILVAMAVLVSRATLCRCVERKFGLRRENYWLIPLQDVIAFAVYVASYFGTTVHWRGADYRVAADGTLIENADGTLIEDQDLRPS